MLKAFWGEQQAIVTIVAVACIFYGESFFLWDHLPKVQMENADVEPPENRVRSREIGPVAWLVCLTHFSSNPCQRLGVIISG